MTAYPIDIEEILKWFRSKAKLLEGSGVQMAGVQANTVHVPNAWADFDSENRIGRITVSVTGEVDFEVLSRSDGEFVLFRHESVTRMDAPELDRGYCEFVANMENSENS